jgi:hypothetical protein
MNRELKYKIGSISLAALMLATIIYLTYLVMQTQDNLICIPHYYCYYSSGFIFAGIITIMALGFLWMFMKQNEGVGD